MESKSRVRRILISSRNVVNELIVRYTIPVVTNFTICDNKGIIQIV
jgi:hypothetical protein